VCRFTHFSSKLYAKRCLDIPILSSPGARASGSGGQNLGLRGAIPNSPGRRRYWLWRRWQRPAGKDGGQGRAYPQRVAFARMQASRWGGTGGGWWWLRRCSVERSRGVGGALHDGDSRGGDSRLGLERIRRRRLVPDLGTSACAGSCAATTGHSRSLRWRWRATRGSPSVLVLSSVWWNGRATVGRVGCFLSVVELVDHGQDHLLPYFRPVAWGLLAWIE
jgi:hypothetical protein